MSTATMTPLAAARARFGWTPDDLIEALRDAAAARRVTITNTVQLRQMVTGWEGGGRTPSTRYVPLLCDVYSADPAALGLTLPDGQGRELATPARTSGPVVADWDAMPLGAVVRAARQGNESARDALTLAGAITLWGVS